MKTKYDGHEDAYQKFRSQPERVGWDDTEQLAANVASMERVLQWPTFPRKGRVLELGCGAGNICIELAKRGFDVYGVDSAPTAIEWATQNSLLAGVAGVFQSAMCLNWQTSKTQLLMLFLMATASIA